MMDKRILKEIISPDDRRFYRIDCMDYVDWWKWPLEITIETQTGCNLQCRHCRIHAQKSIKPFDLKFIEFDRFQKLVARLAPMLRKAVFVGLSSSEPLFHPRIFDMIKEVRKYKPDLFIRTITNGMLLDEKHIKGLLENGIQNACISLDGCKAETQEAIRTGSDFERIIYNIKKFKEIGGDRVFMRTIFVIQKRNIDELLDFVDFCHDLGFQQIKTSGLISYTPEFADHVLYSKEGIKWVDEIVDAAREKTEGYGMPFTREFTKVNYCGCGLTKTVYIDEDGNMSPCTFLNRPTPFTFLGEYGVTKPIIWGNAYKTDPMKIWSSKKCVEFRTILHSKEVPEPCRLCALGHGVIC